MGEPSKDLLDVPSEPKQPFFIESLFAGKEQHNEQGKRKAGPPTDPLPKSQVLGKVKDFLGEMAKANEKLQLDAQNKPPQEYDIEALTGNEKEYIEMDLLLGVADLHSEQAVGAAEATMSGFPPSGSCAGDSYSQRKEAHQKTEDCCSQLGSLSFLTNTVSQRKCSRMYPRPVVGQVGLST
ncbi:hypothetical protein BRADI_2g43670v3 [Brachypodium distachyon]|uniref:Uncharacterized protein n=1 Tax=Brachypodium distachyon TaxID=15368 RepID=A0A0Q3R5L4_BRADI|nr:hypothetical protein BRADI_2g43670v3 [Brachypodium distachyon]